MASAVTFWNLILAIEENVTSHLALFTIGYKDFAHFLSLYQTVPASGTFLFLYLGDDQPRGTWHSFQNTQM